MISVNLALITPFLKLVQEEFLVWKYLQNQLPGCKGQKYVWTSSWQINWFSVWICRQIREHDNLCFIDFGKWFLYLFENIKSVSTLNRVLFWFQQKILNKLLFRRLWDCAMYFYQQGSFINDVIPWGRFQGFCGDSTWALTIKEWQWGGQKSYKIV